MCLLSWLALHPFQSNCHFGIECFICGSLLPLACYKYGSVLVESNVSVIILFLFWPLDSLPQLFREGVWMAFTGGACEGREMTSSASRRFHEPWCPCQTGVSRFRSQAGGKGMWELAQWESWQEITEQRGIVGSDGFSSFFCFVFQHLGRNQRFWRWRTLPNYGVCTLKCWCQGTIGCLYIDQWHSLDFKEITLGWLGG